MRNVPVIILLAFFVQTHAKESTTDPKDEVPLLAGGSRPLSKKANAMPAPTRLLQGLKKAEDNAEPHPLAQVTGTKFSRTESRAWDPPLPSLGGGTWDLEKAKRADVNALGICKAVFNLIKNIVGKGVLSLPAGVAAIGGERALLVPATVLLTTMGTLSAYTFFLYGQLLRANDCTSISKVWTRTVGRRSLLVFKAINVIYPLLGCLAYSLILGESFSALAQGGIFGNWIATHPLATDRRTWILGLTIAVLYPLCSLKKFGALSYTSLLGTMAVAYNAVFMMLRWLDGTYLPGGQYFDSSPVPPSFTGAFAGKDFAGAFKNFFTKPGALVFLAMCEVAFICHQNAPSYYEQAGENVASFGLITVLGFGIAILFNIVFLFSGFLTFGSSSAGMILTSYALNDKLAAIARVLISCSILCSYPLVFNGLKLITTETLTRFKRIKDGFLLNQAITFIALACITGVSFFISSVGIANGITGAVCGSALIYMMPTRMHFGSKRVRKNAAQMALNIVLITFGSLMTVLGTYASIAFPPAQAPAPGAAPAPTTAPAPAPAPAPPPPTQHVPAQLQHDLQKVHPK